MISFEGSGGGAAEGGGGIDRSRLCNLHWKKELTQIRKAARVLRDPGTSSSWWSSPPPMPPPPGSARTLIEHQIKNGRVEGNVASSPSAHLLQVGTRSSSKNGLKNAKERERRRRVCLYNWRSQKSESEMSRKLDDDDDDEDVECRKYEGGSSSSLEADSYNSMRNDNSKSDGYLSDRLAAAFFKCMNSTFTSSTSRRKKKSKRSSYSNPTSRPRTKKLQMKMLLSSYSNNVVDASPSVRSERGNSTSRVDQSDENRYHCNPEDIGRDSALSNMLARLKSKGGACPRVKMTRNHKKDDDSVSYSSTQALSTHSYNRYAVKNALTGLLDDDRLDLAVWQGCGIPCYWSRRSTPKSRNRNRASYSPSLSDRLRRKGCSFLCGSQTMSQARHHRLHLVSKEVDQSLIPLLDSSDDDLSAKFAELDLEALRELVGRGWSSSCRSREGLELVSSNGEQRDEGSSESMRSLSHKYRPMCFEDIIGQHMVIQSLVNAVARGRIAPLYLLHGPHGVGKTSTARAFAAALNCLATGDTKPCGGACRECASFVSGKSRFLEEIDGSDKKGVDRLKTLLRNMPTPHPLELPHYKVLVIDQCHLLPSKAWLEFLRALHKPFPSLVFILITTDVDNVPRTVSTQCQRHVLNKIGCGDIVTRLRKISIEENLDVQPNALELIASNADGSLRDAETVLDQLSLFGKHITKSLVNELMGVVSEDKLQELLEAAMSSNASETVRRSREVMESGKDPLVLISQLVSLIVDIIAGTHINTSVDADRNESFFGGRPLRERELQRLKHAVTLLSEAEKHLRVSSERSAWFTATLLQLGSMPSPDVSLQPRAIEHEQGPETAPLQALDEGPRPPQPMSHSRPEKNQILPREGKDDPNEPGSITSRDVPLPLQLPASPSLLHDSTPRKDNIGCSGMFCWKNRRPQRRRKVR